MTFGGLSRTNTKKISITLNAILPGKVVRYFELEDCHSRQGLARIDCKLIFFQIFHDFSKAVRIRPKNWSAFELMPAQRNSTFCEICNKVFLEQDNDIQNQMGECKIGLGQQNIYLPFFVPSVQLKVLRGVLLSGLVGHRDVLLVVTGEGVGVAKDEGHR